MKKGVAKLNQSATIATCPSNKARAGTERDSMGIKINTTMGAVQYSNSESEMLAHLNRDGRFYAIRDGVNGREIFHKGHGTVYGVIVVA